jgi:hypothetical protein
MKRYAWIPAALGCLFAISHPSRGTAAASPRATQEGGIFIATRGDNQVARLSQNSSAVRWRETAGISNIAIAALPQRESVFVLGAGSKTIEHRRTSDGFRLGSINIDPRFGEQTTLTAMAASEISDEVYVGIFVESLGMGAVVRLPMDGTQQTLKVGWRGRPDRPWKPTQLVVDPLNGDLFMRAEGERTIAVTRASGTTLSFSGDICDVGPIAIKPGRVLVACFDSTGMERMVRALASDSLSIFTGGVPFPGSPVAITYDQERDITYVVSEDPGTPASPHYLTRFRAPSLYNLVNLPEAGAGIAVDTISGDVYVAFSTLNPTTTVDKIYVPDFDAALPAAKREYLGLGSIIGAIYASPVLQTPTTDTIFSNGFD